MDFHTGFFCVAYGRDMPSPHVRGEYIVLATPMFFGYGSSPRAWGIHRGRQQCRLSDAVHPHVRGEYDAASVEAGRQDGSSPRAWGILLLAAAWTQAGRFIPTCVGNTDGCTREVGNIPVHPHVRGEYEKAGKIVTDATGSSPRAWGILWRQGMDMKKDRFIPTCVGNTFRVVSLYQASTVHPHVRGEYPRPNPGASSSVGSSPRAWGIHNSHCLI